MIRRPPRSTLFPYTTLFRSHGVRPVKRAFGAVHDFNFVDVVESEVGEIHVAAGKIHGSSIDKHFGESGVAAINKDGGKAADRAGARKADARLRGQKIGKEDGLALLDFLRADDVNRDRKSTRLNSSHGYISYAVFCLKKKKTPWNGSPNSADLRTHLEPLRTC